MNRWLNAKLLAAFVDKGGEFVHGNAVLAGIQLSVISETCDDNDVIMIIVNELLQTMRLADVPKDGGEDLSAFAVRQRWTGQAHAGNSIDGKHFKRVAILEECICTAAELHLKLRRWCVAMRSRGRWGHGDCAAGWQ